MLTPEAKRLLAETIRGTQQDPEKGLRARLLRAIHDEADRRYRLSVPIGEAGLDEAHRRRRERIEAWVDERARATKPKNKTELDAAKDRLLRQAEKEAAATLINRLVLLRLLEAQGLSKPSVLTGGWNGKGYREFREFGPALAGDDTEGYATLLQLLFDELAFDLPGLYGDVGLTRLFTIPPATLRDVVERLDDPELTSAWTDDTTLGWVYQYWNDPDREALDAKINGGGKIEPHEIASKTQMFTERYMVEWLLQNSLGLTWLAMCRKHGWKADADSVLPVLDARRADWRKKREAGEVPLDALMPIEGELEEHWKYYVPQPIPDDAVEKAPESVRAIKILDPACGSGHFLVIALGLLVAIYREEARHLGSKISDREIVESILENNLHGIDIDPRAIQIAAAGLYLKAKSVSKDCRPKKLNLVAPALQLGNLPPDDPAVAHLRTDLKQEAGIPEELTNKLLSSLAGLDYLGSLLKVDAPVEDAIKNVELAFEKLHGQGDLFGGFPAQQVKLTVVEAKATILDKLEQFLAKHSKSEDLGLRLDGEQLAAGVRFVRMAKEGTYDLVVGNPPYQATSRFSAASAIADLYPVARADLYAAFLLRSLELCRIGGASALLTMRNWMFLGQFEPLRHAMSARYDLRTVVDLGTGAFSSRSMDDVISSVMAIWRSVATVESRVESLAILAAPLADKTRDASKPARRSAALLVQQERRAVDLEVLAQVPGLPFLYWWEPEFLRRYILAPKLGNLAPVRAGMTTGNNSRFLRNVHEVRRSDIFLCRIDEPERPVGDADGWVPYVKGGTGRCWMEDLDVVIGWRNHGLEKMVVHEHLANQGGGNGTPSKTFYFKPGIAFSMIGSDFLSRAHRFRSIFGDKGSSVFPPSVADAVCFMNRGIARTCLQSLNPSVSFQVGDVNRLPVFPVAEADSIFAVVRRAFAEREAGREPSIEFRRPTPTEWAYAQEWAQIAVDRADMAPLPSYAPVFIKPTPEHLVSFAIGVALGRFDAGGAGILDEAPTTTLPSGMFFLASDGADGLDHPACAGIHDAWIEHGAAVGDGDDLRTYLRKNFFDFHKKLYENRPIYFPLSSAKRSFVAYVSIHRWADDTLNVLLADHLVPAKRRLEGELEDLRTARASGNNKGKAEKRFTEVQKVLEELNDFIAKVTEVAEKGPPPSDDKTMRREIDARYIMDLDDGVMVNSAALWPLLEPQWKDPKKWWKELANAQGKKDNDWSHLAARYFPTRVRKKCHEDPSLAVAHKCFWELHPAKAYAWELRLQDEIRLDFTIDEPASNAARAKFRKEHEREADETLTKELNRRAKKNAKSDDAVQTTFDSDESDEAADG